MAEDIELDKLIIKRVEVEVERNALCILLFGRVLYRAEIEYFKILRHYDYASGMLARGLSRSDAAIGKPCFLRFGDIYIVLLTIMLHIAVSGLLHYARNGACTEGMPFAEHDFGKFMRDRLVFSGEIQVDIRGLISLEAEEGFKGYLVAVAVQGRSAVRTVLRRKVNTASGAVADIGEFAVLAFRAAIVRRERIDLGNACHMRNEGGADRAPRTDEIAVGIGFMHELLRDHVKGRIAVANDGIQFLIEPFLDDFRQYLAVELMGFGEREVLKLIRRAGKLRGIGLLIIEERAEHIAHIRYFIGIFNDDLVCLFAAEIAEFIEHIIGRSEI